MPQPSTRPSVPQYSIMYCLTRATASYGYSITQCHMMTREHDDCQHTLPRALTLRPRLCHLPMCAHPQA